MTKETGISNVNRNLASHHQTSKVIEEHIRPKIIKIIENEDYRESYVKQLITRVDDIAKRRPTIHQQYHQSISLTRYAKVHRPKKGLSIGVYRNS